MFHMSRRVIDVLIILQISVYITIHKIGFFLFGVMLIRLTAIIVYKARILNKDSLHMFFNMVIWKKLDLALYTEYCWAIIKTILSKCCSGQKIKMIIIVTVYCISLINLIT